MENDDVPQLTPCSPEETERIRRTLRKGVAGMLALRDSPNSDLAIAVTMLHVYRVSAIVSGRIVGADPEQIEAAGKEIGEEMHEVEQLLREVELPMTALNMITLQYVHEITENVAGAPRPRGAQPDGRAPETMH